MSTDPAVLEKANLFGQIGDSKTTGNIWRAETSALFVQVAALIEAVVAHCGALAAGCREGRQIAARYNELSQLSRVDLARRGLTRQSIARAALGLQRSTSGVQPRYRIAAKRSSQ